MTFHARGAGPVRRQNLKNDEQNDALTGAQLDPAQRLGDQRYTLASMLNFIHTELAKLHGQFELVAPTFNMHYARLPFRNWAGTVGCSITTTTKTKYAVHPKILTDCRIAWYFEGGEGDAFGISPYTKFSEMLREHEQAAILFFNLLHAGLTRMAASSLKRAIHQKDAPKYFILPGECRTDADVPLFFELINAFLVIHVSDTTDHITFKCDDPKLAVAVAQRPKESEYELVGSNYIVLASGTPISRYSLSMRTRFGSDTMYHFYPGSRNTAPDFLLLHGITMQDVFDGLTSLIQDLSHISFVGRRHNGHEGSTPA